MFCTPPTDVSKAHHCQRLSTTPPHPVTRSHYYSSKPKQKTKEKTHHSTCATLTGLTVLSVLHGIGTGLLGSQ